MRKAIKEATSELIAMQEQFGKTSPQAIAAAQRIAQLKDRIQDAREQADLFDPGKRFQAFANAASTVASGFAAVQGAMALVGSESKDLERTLVKVQGAMALAQGLSAVRDAGKAFEELKVTIASSGIAMRAFAISGNIASGAMRLFGISVTTTSTAFKVLRGAILATGIGALVVALGFVVEKVMQWADSTKETEKNVNDLKKANDKLNASLDNQIAILEAVGGKEREIYALRNQRANNELNSLRQIYKEQGGLTEEQNKRFNQLKTELVVNDIKENNRLRDENDKHNAELKKKNDAHRSAQIKDQKQYNDKSEQLRQEKQEKEKAALDAIAVANEELTKRNLSNQQKELFDLKKQYEEKKKVIEDGGKSAASLTELYEKQRFDIELKYKNQRQEQEKKFQDLVSELVKRSQTDRSLSEQETARKAVADKYAKEREELLKQYPNNLMLMILLKQNEQKDLDAVDVLFKQKKLEKNAADALTEASNQELSFQERRAKITEREQLANQITFKSDEERTAFNKANSEARKKIAQEEANAIVQAADAVANTLTNASKILGENTKAGKALAIASATISMFTSAQKAYAATVGIPYVGPILAPINAALAIAAGIKNIKEIGKVKVPGGGGGGGSVPNPTPPPPGNMNAPLSPTLSSAVQGQALNSQAINNLGNQSLRAYVMNSDIQNNNQRNAYLERNARIG
jgi:hypothetical protein